MTADVIERGPRERIPSIAVEGPLSVHRDWQDQIACADTEVEFVSDLTGKPYHTEVAKARAICAECPVRRECLEYAFEQPSSTRYGVYGGTTPQQRRRLKDHPDRIERLLEEAWA